MSSSSSLLSEQGQRRINSPSIFHSSRKWHLLWCPHFILLYVWCSLQVFERLQMPKLQLMCVFKQKGNRFFSIQYGLWGNLCTRMDSSISKTLIYQMQLSHCFCWLILPENRLNTCNCWDFKQHFMNHLSSEWELCKLDFPMWNNSELSMLTRWKEFLQETPCPKQKHLTWQ